MKQEDKLLHLIQLAKETSVLRQAVVEQLGSSLVDTANLISGVIGAGGKLLLAGNGGSAAQASHFAAELVVRLTAERNRQALPAVALCVDPSVMTASGNDFGFEHVFSRQVEGLGNRGDMLIILSTSGNSRNLVKAARTAREKGLITVALLGGTGGKLGGMVERSLVVPHAATQRVQEEHQFIIHVLVELVEEDLCA
ncbi:MAG TPA: SIS domain-containing protein [Acidobacteriota bacterium]|nr:SIS domain-containing protein [Acidobacteriota bacterium]